MRSSSIPILLAFLAIACHDGADDEAAHSTTPSAAIEATTINRGRVERTLETYGTVELPSDLQHSVPVVTSGQVLDVAVIAGQAVKKGDALLRLGPVPSGSPQLQQARIDAEFAERELNRIRKLVGDKLATNKDLQDAEKAAAAARATMRALGGSAAAGVSIKTPVDGIVASVHLQRGDVVQAGQPAVVIAAGNTMAVRAGFEVEDLPELEPGLTVWLTPVHRAAQKARAQARLSRLHRVVDPATQLLEGVINVAQAPHWMAAGLAVRVEVVLEAHDDAICVPRLALLDRAGKSGVFVIEANRAHWIPLEIGIRGRELLEVTSGLSPGDTVATVGRSSLSDGMPVRITGPTMDPP